MARFYDVQQDVRSFLFLLRSTLQSSASGGLLFRGIDEEDLIKVILIIEETSLRVSRYGARRGPVSDRDLENFQNDLGSFLKKMRGYFLDSPHVLELSMPSRKQIYRFDSEFPRYMGEFKRTEKYKFGDIINIFGNYIDKLSDNIDDVQSELRFGDIISIVPQQKVAPAQFDVVNGKVTILRRPPVKTAEDANNIKSTLEHLREGGSRLVDSLTNSNCDPRFLQSFINLKTQIESNENIVKIGLMNIECGYMFSEFKDELPSAIVGMFGSYSMGVSMYVSQFPEWKQFTENADFIDFHEGDYRELGEAVKNVVAQLENNPELADPEVPKTIEFLGRFFTNPAPSAKRAAFAAIRTVENLISSIVRYSISFMSKFSEELAEAGAIAASRLVVGLLVVALAGATGIGPIAARAGAPWVEQVIDILREKIK